MVSETMAEIASRSCGVPGMASAGMTASQIGEVAGFADVLLPRSRPLGDPHPQRVVVVDHRSHDTADILRTHLAIKTQHQRHPPAARLGQPAVEETRMFGGTGGFRSSVSWLASPPSAYRGDEGVGQRDKLSWS